MAPNVLEDVDTDEVQTGTERVPKTAGDFLGAIDTKAAALKAAAERDQDLLTVKFVCAIATGLKNRVRAVCAGGIWKEIQRLEKDIGKFEHTVKHDRKYFGKTGRRDKARGMGN